MSLFKFHRHSWENIGVDHYWVLRYFECHSSTGTRYWARQEVFQTSNPGPDQLNCSRHGTHWRYPVAHTIIQQRCACGKYRAQHVDGIIKEPKDCGKG